MPVPLLAFDTSTEAMAIGVDGPRVARGWNGPGGAQASATLVPRLRAMLVEQGMSLGDLGAIAFGAGPGAFTGLRTAVAVAQGLAMGTGLAVVPIDSLEIVAEDARAQGGGDDVGVVMDARMGEVYAAHYRWRDAGWHAVMSPRLCGPDDLAMAWRDGGPVALAGSGVSMLDPALTDGRPSFDMKDRARALLQLARRRFESGEVVDAADALPTYLRDKVAQTTAERAALAASRTAVGGGPA